MLWVLISKANLMSTDNAEAILMGTHNNMFFGELRTDKNSLWIIIK